VSQPAKGEIWWGEAPDTKGRPYLVLTRDEAIPVLRAVLVAPVTRTIRGIPTEVLLNDAEGMPTACAASMDNVLSFPKVMLTRRIGVLATPRRHELCTALRAAADC
jgi:mRNA interferase MazF